MRIWSKQQNRKQYFSNSIKFFVGTYAKLVFFTESIFAEEILPYDKLDNHFQIVMFQFFHKLIIKLNLYPGHSNSGSLLYLTSPSLIMCNFSWYLKQKHYNYSKRRYIENNDLVNFSFSLLKCSVIINLWKFLDYTLQRY